MPGAETSPAPEPPYRPLLCPTVSDCANGRISARRRARSQASSGRGYALFWNPVTMFSSRDFPSKTIVFEASCRPRPPEGYYFWRFAIASHNKSIT